MSILLASGFVGSGFSAIHFMVGFIILVCVLAVVIVAGKWLIGLTGLAVPQPLMVILGILVFLLIFLWLLSWSGVYNF